jgi:ATP-dependent helicase/nuclease subunit B
MKTGLTQMGGLVWISRQAGDAATVRGIVTESMSHRWQHWLDAVAEALRARQVHPARAVVLLPYAQLMPVAARLWGARYPTGFAPRFETTQNWAHALAGSLAAADMEATNQGSADLRLRPALDALTAHVLLEQAGLGAQAAVAAPLLLEAAQQLAPLAAAQVPGQRDVWGQHASRAARTGLEAMDESVEGAALRLEAAIAQIAVAWVVNSSYGSDAFFSSEVRALTDCLVVLPGLQPDPLIDGLRQAWGERLVVLDAPAPARDAAWVPPLAGITFHEADDAAQEAQWAAACVLRHLAASRQRPEAPPVAVAVIDRALTRRLRAMLAAHGVQIRDETGWKLSTTRAGARLMVALRACARDASSDAVLDWLKHAPACGEAPLRTLEAALRRQPRRLWRHAAAGLTGAALPNAQAPGRDERAQARAAVQATVREIDHWRAVLNGGAGRRTLQEWLSALQTLLLACGLWDTLVQDDAGREALQVLHYQVDQSQVGEDEGGGSQATVALRLPGEALWTRSRWSLGEFTTWVDRALESASFKPAYPPHEQVVLLPLAQMLGRDFSAIVLPGCDERSLPAVPEPSGPWTAAQRAALGLPTREALQAAQQAAWDEALSRPCPVDIVWRRGDADGESLLPSPLVQWLQWQAQDEAPHDGPAAVAPGAGLLELRPLAPQPTPRPAPRLTATGSGALLPQRLSASAYQDLRHCPYRYYALRLLGLREAEEIEDELDKRDFGLWLHAVLQTFHEQDEAGSLAREDRAARLDAAAQAVAREQRLADDEFLPFMAAWPRVREGYLDWLGGHETEGWRFAEGEADKSQPLGAFTLFGQLDRVDRGVGQRMVIDYKTEAAQTTSARIREPLEDTQLAFYAALLPEDSVRAAYVNVGEGETRIYEQADVVAARDALIEGVMDELGRVAQGEPLPALGEGKVCETCAVRGLCRKDFWGA